MACRAPCAPIAHRPPPILPLPHACGGGQLRGGHTRPTAKNPWRYCLRHSYATYYLKARLGEITRLQLNMGHRSAQLLYSRYVNMAGTTRDMAKKWWQTLPE